MGVGIVPEDLQKNNIIEELYNNHMWVTDLQYQFLCNYLNQDGYTEEKLLDLLQKYLTEWEIKKDIIIFLSAYLR